MCIIAKYQCSLFSTQYIPVEEYSRYGNSSSRNYKTNSTNNKNNNKLISAIILSSPIGYLNQTESACRKGAANPIEQMRIVAGPIVIGVSQFKAKEYELKI